LKPPFLDFKAFATYFDIRLSRLPTGEVPMILQIVEESTCHRFVVDDSDGWTAANFFSELDRVFSAIKQVAGKENKDVVFDLSGLARVDSSMITLLVQTIRVVGNRKISIITPDRETSHLLSLMGIDKLAHMYDSEEEWRSGIEHTNLD
jgi:ABC-type transporter Mla MlaB component